MSNLLKSLFKTNKTSTPEEIEAIEKAEEALKSRMRHYLASTHDKAA